MTLIFSVCCVLRLARFNLTNYEEEEKWKINFFQGIPSPAGGIIILLPLIYDLTSFDVGLDIKKITPFLVGVTAILLISKLPTFSFKKISIPRSLTIFILFGIGVSFISLIFFTFETLFIGSLLYLFTLPISLISYINKKKEIKTQSFEEEHEDVL